LDKTDAFLQGEKLVKVCLVDGLKAVAVIVAGKHGVKSIAVAVGQSCGIEETDPRTDDDGFGFIEGGFEDNCFPGYITIRINHTVSSCLVPVLLSLLLSAHHIIIQFRKPLTQTLYRMMLAGKYGILLIKKENPTCKHIAFYL
jgi:hypothetical protein